MPIYSGPGPTDHRWDNDRWAQSWRSTCLDCKQPSGWATNGNPCPVRVIKFVDSMKKSIEEFQEQWVSLQRCRPFMGEPTYKDRLNWDREPALPASEKLLRDAAVALRAAVRTDGVIVFSSDSPSIGAVVMAMANLLDNTANDGDGNYSLIQTLARAILKRPEPPADEHILGNVLSIPETTGWYQGFCSCGASFVGTKPERVLLHWEGHRRWHRGQGQRRVQQQIEKHALTNLQVSSLGDWQSICSCGASFSGIDSVEVHAHWDTHRRGMQ